MGEMIGEKNDADKFGRLAAFLFDNGQVDEVRKASADPDYRDKMFAKYADVIA